MSSASIIVSNLLGLAGALVGGTIGYLLFGAIAYRGYNAHLVPGGLLGFGCGLLARHKSEPRGILCGLAAFVLTLYCESRFFPFSRDDRLDYFIRHLGDLDSMTWIMLILGSLIADYLARTPGRG